MKYLNNKVFRTIFAWVIIGLITYFFGKSLINNWSQLQDVHLSFNTWSIVSIVLFALAVVWTGVLWGKLISQLSKKPITNEEAIKVHSLSWLLKYIPGQAGSLLNKITWAKKRGYSKKLVTVTFIYEHAFLIFASLLLSIPIVAISFFEQTTANLGVFAPLLLAVPLLLLLNQKAFYTLLNYVFKIFKKKPIEKEYILQSKQLFYYVLKFLGPRLVNGIGFIFVVASITYIPEQAYIGLVAAYVLAGAVGLLAIFVPSGIGVREAVIVLFTSQYFSIEVAIVLSLVARLYATLGDGVVALIYGYLLKKEKRNQ